MVDRPGITTPEIAEIYGRSLDTVTKEWTQEDTWPAPIGKRDRYKEYDRDAVAAWVKANIRTDLTLPIHTGDPDALLTKQEIAAESGLSYGTVRADLSRGRLLPKEGERTDEAGVPLWRRGTIAHQLAARRRRRTSKP